MLGVGGGGRYVNFSKFDVRVDPNSGGLEFGAVGVV